MEGSDVTWSRALQELAGTGAGIVDRHGALAAGVPLDAVDREARSGRLVVMHPGVYRAAAVSCSPDVRLRAAVLAAGPDAVCRTDRPLIVTGSCPTCPTPLTCSCRTTVGSGWSA